MLLNVEFQELESKLDIKFEAGFQEVGSSLDLAFGEQIVIENITNYPYYEGDYEVTPSIESKTLPTKKRVMIDDLTIKEIPVYETSNLAGGTTVYIAKE